MQSEYILLEVLLNINSSFSKREWNFLEDASHPVTPKEQLEEICWNGLLPELLPEIYHDSKEAPVLWQLDDAGEMLHLQLIDGNLFIDPSCSLHPYLLERSLCLN